MPRFSSTDLVEYGATPYTGDAHLADWPATLEALRALKPEKPVPGRGEARTTLEDCEAAMVLTQAFITDLFEAAKRGPAQGMTLKQTFDTARAAMDQK